MRTFLIAFGVIIVLALVVLAGCSWLNGAAPDGNSIAPDLEPQTPADASQEKAFTGLRWMLLVGVSLAALGAGLLFIPLPGLKSWSVPCFASGGFMAFMSITLNQHYLLISWIGLGIGLAGIVLLGWMVWKNRDKLEATWTALLQVVTGNDLAKKVLPEEIKEKLYGAPDHILDRGLVGNVQSPATEKLVAKIRKAGNNP